MPDVTDAEVKVLYDCVFNSMKSAEANTGSSLIVPAAWSDGDSEVADSFTTWKNFATQPYISATHAGRYAVNFANAIAAPAYGKYEDIGAMPVGGIIAKPTFTVRGDGQAYLETLFVMEKKAAGTSPDTNDWIYASIGGDGSILMQTGGAVDGTAEGCAACHMAIGAGQDDLAFIPEEYRLH
jgi:hypothetical protein